MRYEYLCGSCHGHSLVIWKNLRWSSAMGQNIGAKFTPKAYGKLGKRIYGCCSKPPRYPIGSVLIPSTSNAPFDHLLSCETSWKKTPTVSLGISALVTECSSAAWNLYAVRHGILDGHLREGKPVLQPRDFAAKFHGTRFLYEEMWVSLKWGYPQIINFHRIVHSEQSILGYPKVWKPPNHELGELLPVPPILNESIMEEPEAKRGNITQWSVSTKNHLIVEPWKMGDKPRNPRDLFCWDLQESATLFFWPNGQWLFQMLGALRHFHTSLHWASKPSIPWTHTMTRLAESSCHFGWSFSLWGNDDRRDFAQVDRWCIMVYRIIYRVSTCFNHLVQDFFHPQ